MRRNGGIIIPSDNTASSIDARGLRVNGLFMMDLHSGRFRGASRGPAFGRLAVGRNAAILDRELMVGVRERRKNRKISIRGVRNI